MDKKTFFERYNVRTHIYGRIGLIIGLVLMLGMPFAMGLVLNAMPDMSAFWKGFIQVAVVYIPSCIVEFLIYTPMLGSGGSYLAFITGNLINMKIPCAVNARDLAGVKAGTKENEIVSTLSIAVSSLVTILVLAVGVLLLQPLLPLLQSPALQPAFDNVVPALFGAMAYKYYRKNMGLAIWPLLMMAALFILVPSLQSQTSILILPSGALAIGLAWLKFRKERKA